MSLRAAREKARARTQQAKPKGALGSLRARKNGAVESAPAKGALGALKARKKKPALARLKERRNFVVSKLDFVVNGLRYHNVRVLGQMGDRPFGSVTVSSGDAHVEFHNRHLGWLHDVPGREGHHTEPRTLEIKVNLSKRWEAELKARGIPTASEARAHREAEEAAQRKKEATAKKQAAAKKKRAAAMAKARKKTTGKS